MSDGQEKPGISTTAKVLIGLAVAGVLGLAICCGGAVWFGTKAVDAVKNAVNVTQDPEQIRKTVAAIASLDIPTGWEPVMGMEMNIGFQMKMAVFSPDQTKGSRSLVLMQMKMPGQNEQQMEQQMRVQMQTQMQMNQQGRDQQISIESSETKTFEIDGEEREFLFAVGTNGDGETVHQVTGVFKGKDGTAMLTLVEDDENWDEEAVQKLIESISTQTPAEQDD